MSNVSLWIRFWRKLVIFYNTGNLFLVSEKDIVIKKY
jgi:hypothetical protein